MNLEDNINLRLIVLFEEYARYLHISTLCVVIYEPSWDILLDFLEEIHIFVRVKVYSLLNALVLKHLNTKSVL